MSAACRRLDGTRDLPSSASIDVIKGLQQTSVERFKKFWSIQQHKVEEANLIPGGQRAWGHETALDKINWILTQALEFYDVLTTSHEWNVPKGGKFAQVKVLTYDPSKLPCWNCGKPGCRVRKCSGQKDKKCITEKFNEEKMKYK